ncbi:MAG: TGS domain-containing protein, partial [Lachnospiraceae bacterium]|nr:TGS domain-containing protein [Lachnospiraceae bacterium]
MHRTAEYGIAAHWKYKENQYGQGTAASEEEKLAWLRHILEWQRDMSDNKEFLSLLKSDLDLFSDHVYCFTKDGDVKNLPAGSTPIDFAYAVHSAVGNKMVGARVNGNLVTIDYQIQNGDRIEIITSQNSKGPSRDWLALVKSTQAKNKINQWFRTEFKEENILQGKEMLANYAKNQGIALSDLLKPEYQSMCLKKYGFKDWNSVLAAIGHGGLKEGQVISKLQDAYNKKNPKHATDQDILDAVNASKVNRSNDRNRISVQSKSGIMVAGIDDVSVRFSRCCSPVPGDEIIGFVTRGRGVSIHRTDCINMMNLSETDRQRIIEAEWQIAPEGNADELFDTEIIIYANDRIGVLLDLTKVFTESGITIRNVNTRTSKQGIATITIGFAIRGVEALQNLTAKLQQVESVRDIERTKS